MFGDALASDLELPDLARALAADPPRWTVTVADGAPPPADAKLIGARQLGPEAYTLWRMSDGFRLEYSHAGVFDITDSGSRIVWYRRADAIPELVRAIVLGPALALALELAGLFCLHGSAVRLGDTAMAFVGPKHHGKSTLATALTAAGARLIGDDLVAISPGPPAIVRPGVASVRLWADAVAAVGIDRLPARVIPGLKATVTDFADASRATEDTLLSDIYVLAPVSASGRGGSEPPCWRTALPRGAAAVVLAQQTKLAATLVGIHAAGTQLRVAARIAESVRVWTLSVARDLSRLPAIVDVLRGWNREAA
ncbi:MAG TPA: hypothetical protein VHM30_08875 [Gemmatimonadaceae bacterium]|nr:hypothetical protein [Gemmatimonadaceae bacterium]